MRLFYLINLVKFVFSVNLDQTVFFPYYIESEQKEARNLNACPELLYFFNYEPFIKSQAYTLTLQSFTEKSKFNKKRRNVSKFKSQIKQNYDHKHDLPSVQMKDLKNEEYFAEESYEDLADGPFYSILSQTYDVCCSLNTNPLTPVRVKDDTSMYELLFDTYNNESSILNYKTKGIFSIIELTEMVLNPNLVAIMTSPSFYLITKREHNGSPTFTPIAITILINAWPILVFFLLANAYAAVFVWFLDKTMKQNQFPREFVKGTSYTFWWSFIIFTANK
ncbi:potassium channel [Brachionus plicatilis]|uniref:Potassium channel n=1 Tax=Brachionus plicatilis TaxID=10195 RepID=A0A3M7Q3C6_BRAPC|nr:potassium channel [Brachionus plicatilis]